MFQDEIINKLYRNIYILDNISRNNLLQFRQSII